VEAARRRHRQDPFQQGGGARFRQRADTLSQQMPLLNSSMEQVVNILQQRNGSSDEMLGTSRQMLSADRIIRRVQEVLQGGDNAQSAADGLSRDAQLYGNVLKGLLRGQFRKVA
jgi:twitching motility protein PilJ